MSDDIVFTVKEGAGTGFTIFGEADDARAAAATNSKPVLSQLEMASGSGFEVVKFAGFSNLFPKFMGGETNLIIISGYMVGATAVILLKGLKILLRTNKTKALWLAKLGGENLTDPDGAFIENVAGKPFGEGSGPRWPFVLTLRNVGPDADTPS